jgi:transcription initiation factor TFIIIB Brf1 subunit/transcription initiation factor TFIIB
MIKKGKKTGVKKVSKAKKGAKYVCDACGMVVTVPAAGRICRF